MSDARRILQMWVTNPPLVRAVLVTIGVALTALAAKTPWSPLPLGVIIASGVTASVALWWHDRRPGWVTLAGALAHPLSGNPWPLLVGLFSAGSLHHPRRLPAVAAVGALGFAALEWVEAAAIGLQGLVSAGLLTVSVIAVGVYVGTRRKLVASLRDQADTAAAERHLRLQQARVAERTRIAREMHDVLGHKVSLIALHAGALEVNPDAGSTTVAETAVLIRSTAREALDELRSVLGVLRDGTVHGGEGDPGGPTPVDGAPTDLSSLVAAWRQAGADVELDEGTGALPPTLGRAVHRVVQEGLTNAHRHATGACITVTTTGGGGADIVVTVANGVSSGAGDDASAGSGTGLIGLGERLRLIGGTLHAGPEPGGGWRVEGRIPWPAAPLRGWGDGRPDDRPGAS